LFDIRMSDHVHPIRVIIDASSRADIKTRSRWCLALRHVWNERRHWSDFEEFFSANGGPAGCVRLFALSEPTRPRKRVNYRRASTGRPFLVIAKRGRDDCNKAGRKRLPGRFQRATILQKGPLRVEQPQTTG